MKNLGYYNGIVCPLEELMIPVGDRAVYFGDGVYEAVGIRNKIPFGLGDHIDRFYNSMAQMRIDFSMSKEELQELLLSLIEKLSDFSAEHGMYWQATRGGGFRRHAFPEDAKSNLLVTIVPSPFQKFGEKICMITAEDKRALMCNVKTLNLVPNILAKQMAVEAGCYDAILHRGEIVTEGTHHNVSILKDGVYRTHPANNLILHGITRKHHLELCRKNGIPVLEKEFTLAELFDADEVIVTNCVTLCAVAVKINQKDVGGRDPELLERIISLYREKFEKETSK